MTTPIWTKAWWLGMAERVGTTFLFAFGGALSTDGVISGVTNLHGVHWLNDLSIAAVAAILSLVKAATLPAFTAGTPPTSTTTAPATPPATSADYSK